MGLTARDIMQTRLVTAHADESIETLLGRLLEHHVSGAPVIDDRGHVLGVISLSDIAEALEPARGLREAAKADSSEIPSRYFRSLDLVGPLFRQRETPPGLERPVREIMTPYVIDVSPDTPIDVLCRRMCDLHLHRLLVTESRRLVGVISALDVLALVARGALHE